MRLGQLTVWVWVAAAPRSLLEAHLDAPKHGGVVGLLVLDRYQSKYPLPGLLCVRLWPRSLLDAHGVVLEHGGDFELRFLAVAGYGLAWSA